MSTEFKKEASGRDSRKPGRVEHFRKPGDHAPKGQPRVETEPADDVVLKDCAYKISSLHKKYQHYHLEIDDLRIPYLVVALLGESGAGKTTLLNILALLDTDYQGQVELDGEILKRGIHEADVLRQNRFCFAFQTSNLLVNMPVAANVELSRRLAGYPLYPEGRKTSVQVLEKFFSEDGEARPGGKRESKVARLAPRYPSELSVGQRQRVAVARAMLKAEDGANVFFADEPTANVDRRTADSCFDALTRWQRAGKEEERRLLLLATHDLTLACKADYVILLKTEPDPTDPDGVRVTVDPNGTGPTGRCWDHVHKALTSREGQKGVQAPVQMSPTSDKERRAQVSEAVGRPEGQEEAQASGQRNPTSDCASKSQPGPATDLRTSLLAVMHFLLAYCWRDISRRRNALETAIRLLVIVFLFLVVAAATTFIRAVPPVRERLIENNRLLRLVELESTGGFPVSLEKMKHLASLHRSESGIQAGIPVSGPAAGIVAGVSPKRQLPLLFYDAQNQLCTRWVDQVRVVYQGHPDLPYGEQLFDFWGIAPMESDTSVLVSPKLLTRLGFDPNEFARRLASKDPTACLIVNEEDWRVRLEVERIEEFPDDDVELLIPATLAQMVAKRDPRITMARYGTAGFGIYATEQAAAAQMPKVQEAVGRFRIRHADQAAFTCSVRHSLEADEEAYVIWVQSDGTQGLDEHQWALLRAEVDQSTGREHRVEHGGRVLGGGEQVTSAPPADAHMATMFVRDYRDVPDVLAYLDAQRDTLKVRVLNAENLEFVRTVRRTASLGTRVVGAVTVMFLCTCLVAIAYSFVAMLHRKLGEIGILRAYGASRRFVFSRFALEIAGVCVFGAVASAFVFFGAMLPYVSNMATDMFPDLFAGNGRLLAFSPMFVWVSLIIVTVVGLVVGVLAWLQVRRSPADLLANNA